MSGIMPKPPKQSIVFSRGLQPNRDGGYELTRSSTQRLQAVVDHYANGPRPSNNQREFVERLSFRDDRIIVSGGHATFKHNRPVESEAEVGVRYLGKHGVKGNILAETTARGVFSAWAGIIREGLLDVDAITPQNPLWLAVHGEKTNKWTQAARVVKVGMVALGKSEDHFNVLPVGGERGLQRCMQERYLYYVTQGVINEIAPRAFDHAALGKAENRFYARCDFVPPLIRRLTA
jgi:hypothetical protein